MSNFIKVSKKYFLKHLVTELKTIYNVLVEIDKKTYNENKFNDIWVEIRDSNLKLEELIESLSKYEN